MNAISSISLLSFLQYCYKICPRNRTFAEFGYGKMLSSCNDITHSILKLNKTVLNKKNIYKENKVVTISDTIRC